MTKSITWYHKALIGAIGGIALVLLKLIDADFFVEAAPKEATIGYLTYSTYIVLGMIVAVFLGEQDDNPQKQKKSCFFCGLLAPSILIAILSGPGGDGQVPTEGLPVETESAIPSLGAALPVSEASFVLTAYQAMPQQQAPAQATPQVKKLSKRDVQPTTREAFLHVIGRAPSQERYVHVAGKSPESTRAVEAAKKINRLLVARDPGARSYAQVVQPANTSDYYVIIGEVGSLEQALAVKQHVQKSALTSITDTQRVSDKDTALLLLKGAVVKASALFE